LFLSPVPFFVLHDTYIYIRARTRFAVDCVSARTSAKSVTTATLVATVSGRSATTTTTTTTSLLHQWPVGLAAAVAARGTDDNNGGRTAMTVHELTAASAAGTMPLHHLGRSRFMITDILSDSGRNNTINNNNGGGGVGSPVSPASSTDGPRDLSLHGRASSGGNGGHGAGPAGGGGGGGPADSDLSDDHESGTDSGLPGDNSSVCSNGKSTTRVGSKHGFLFVGRRRLG